MIFRSFFSCISEILKALKALSHGRTAHPEIINESSDLLIAHRPAEWATLSDSDSEYLEKFVKELYSSELDKKDKILSSLTIVTTPATLLLGALTYLIKFVLTNNADENSKFSLAIEILFYLSTFSSMVMFGIAFFNLHKILAGSEYAYVPDAKDVLDTLIEDKIDADKAARYFDGMLKSEGRERFVPRYAEAARINAWQAPDR